MDHCVYTPNVSCTTFLSWSYEAVSNSSWSEGWVDLSPLPSCSIASFRRHAHSIKGLVGSTLSRLRRILPTYLLVALEVQRPKSCRHSANASPLVTSTHVSCHATSTISGFFSASSDAALSAKSGHASPAAPLSRSQRPERIKSRSIHSQAAR